MRKTFLLAILCPILSLAQPIKHKQPLTPLSVGDTLPIGTLNYKPLTTNNKLVVLDFLATWCGACVRELPKLDSLQKRFTGRLQVVLVAHEPAQKITAFRKKNRTMAASTLPVIAGDTVLHSLFPHKILPHTVWIGADRKVLAITYPSEVNETNISAALEGAPLRLPRKKDNLEFDRSKPLLQEGNGGGDDLLLGRSLLTAYIDGLFSGTTAVFSPDSTTRRTAYFNQSILQLYLTATGFRGPRNRILLEVSDSSRFIRRPGESWPSWAPGRAFCYELTAPAALPHPEALALMRQDLDRYLRLHGRIENRRVPCWVLVRINPAAPLPPAKDGKPVNNLAGREGEPKYMLASPLSALVQALNNQAVGYPLRPIVIDETGYTAPVDLHVTASLDDLPALRKDLQPYGLDLLPAHRELEVLVISDKVPQIPNPKPHDRREKNNR